MHCAMIPAACKYQALRQLQVYYKTSFPQTRCRKIRQKTILESRNQLRFGYGYSSDCREDPIIAR